MMKTALLSLLLSTLSLALWGQGKPRWTLDAEREHAYPQQAYFTGYAEGNLRPNEAVAEAKKRLQREAQALLVESIRVKVESRTTSNNRSTRVNFDERLEGMLAANVQTSAKAEVVGIRSEAPYYDAEAGTVYAFAYAKRTDLAAYYQKQVNADLNRAAVAVDVASQYLTARKKASARSKVNEAERILDSPSLSFYGSLLMAVGADESTLHKRQGDLQRAVEQLLMDIELHAATTVYMDCSFQRRGTRDDAFGDDEGAFCDIIISALYENDCQVVEDETEADYTLTLITSTTLRSDGSHKHGMVSYYANARGWLTKSQTKREVANFRCEGRGCAPYSTSATDAFKDAALKNYVLERILPKVKN